LKVLVVFGTRPEAIKMAPVVRALAASERVRAIVCSTGQHKQMLQPVLELFAIRTDHDLEVMRPNQSLNGLTARIVEGIDRVLAATAPDRVLVHGDTTTAAAASLAAFHRRIPIGHVEAGLRTGRLDQPWPEEMNRRVVDIVADQLYAPTAGARDNLLAESLGEKRIAVTGNTVIDALLHTVATIERDRALAARLARRFDFLIQERRMVLVTGHRRESFGQGFADICRALAELAERPDLDIVYPVHLNPNVREPVMGLLGGCPRVHLIEPVDYAAFVWLMRRADVILTDSGGVQEEAPSLGKPVLVMRNVTERPEAVAAGTARLVGTDPDRIVAMACAYLDEPMLREDARSRTNPYGDGRASRRILEEILS
jgi:UDP-N-acetylglucosamine 2-epimerase (non-hydrolysing)